MNRIDNKKLRREIPRKRIAEIKRSEGDQMAWMDRSVSGECALTNASDDDGDGGVFVR